MTTADQHRISADDRAKAGWMTKSEALELVERQAKALRVPMSHVPRDPEYLSVLSYRAEQEIAAAELRIAALRDLQTLIAAHFIDAPLASGDVVQVKRGATLEQFDVASLADVKRGKGEKLVVDHELEMIPLRVVRVCDSTLIVQDDFSGVHAIVRKRDAARAERESV